MRYQYWILSVIYHIAITQTLFKFILSDKEQEEKILQAITAARKKVKGEIQELTDKLKQNKETKQKLREELAKLEDKGY